MALEWRYEQGNRVPRIHDKRMKFMTMTDLIGITLLFSAALKRIHTENMAK
jgi:hypothetical protein